MTMSATRDRDRGIVTFRITSGPVTCQVEEYDGHALSFWHDLGKLVAYEDNEARAKAGYGRYFKDAQGKSAFSDALLIPWDDLPEKVRGHWIAAFTD